jgi:hypothetical protein
LSIRQGDDNVDAQTVTFNFDHIREIAHKGVRRAAVFLGLGLNAAYDKEFTDYRLSKITQIDIVPPDADDNTIAAFKKEFSFWIIGNGLRELVETFSIFLDRLHEACLVFKTSKGSYTQKQLREECTKFHYFGLSEKLATIKQEFALAPDNPDHLISINKARNCLTHRRGKVGVQDVGADNKLHLNWKGMDVFVKTPGGEEIPLIPGGLNKPIHLQDGGDVMLRIVQRSQTFSLGEGIILTPVDLSEMCQVFAEETNHLCKGGMDYAQRLGIPKRDGGKNLGLLSGSQEAKDAFNPHKP